MLFSSLPPSIWFGSLVFSLWREWNNNLWMTTPTCGMEFICNLLCRKQLHNYDYSIMVLILISHLPSSPLRKCSKFFAIYCNEIPLFLYCLDFSSVSLLCVPYVLDPITCRGVVTFFYLGYHSFFLFLPSFYLSCS